MKARSDQELLRDYARNGLGAAFSELVRRHLDLVYSAAVRIVVDRHLAQDVTQRVFVALAKDAWKLASRTVLSSWLHVTTRNLAAKTVRTEVRRRAREQEVTTMESISADSVWDHIAPRLDEAITEISEADRDAIMLRFFERKSARQIGERLGLSEEAAQKRVTRALHRLGEILRSRGATMSLPALSVAISSQSVQAAPAGLASVIAVQALAKALAEASIVSSVLKPFALVARLHVKPIAASAALLACVSVGTGGYATGRSAAAKHSSAVAWQNAISASAPLEPARPAPEPQPSATTDAKASDRVPKTSSVSDVLAAAAAHFRSHNTDPDAWAKGYVVLEQLGSEQVAEALRLLEHYRDERGVFGAMAPLIAGLWAKFDPHAALEYSLTQLPPNTLSSALEHVCRAWAEQDLVAAWTWFRKTTESGERPIRQDTWQALAKNIFAQWVARDSRGAFNQLARLDFADEQFAIFGIAAAAAEPELRPAILAGVAGLVNDDQKRRAAVKIASRWAKLQPQAAAQWATSLRFENPAARLQVMGEVAEEWWPMDPHATARWLLVTAPVELRDQVAEFLRSAPSSAQQK
ncbi:MAG: sigma-70 family RNA polymerase sigma factor [Verrucomicrobiota bacterium]|nr:sigma-70 family RNA polymerase sigma factor [Verrucomicrobiota bacterium]